MQYIITSIVIFFTEFFWKDHVEKKIKEGSSKEAFHNTIILTKYRNYGAFLNMGAKRPAFIRLISVVITVITLVLFICSLGTVGNGMLKAGFSLLLGGAFSNTYDRLKRGYVVDYFRINVPIKAVRRIIFNVSDFCIIIGAAFTALGWQKPPL